MTSAKGEKQLGCRSAKNLCVPFARHASDGTYETSAEDEIGRRVVAPWGEITKCRGTLRAVVGRALDTELLEPAPQGVGVETQESDRALRPVDHPACLPEDVEDVVTLDIFEDEARAGSGRRDGLPEDVRADLQRGPGREDDGALEDIRDFSPKPPGLWAS